MGIPRGWNWPAGRWLGGLALWTLCGACSSLPGDSGSETGVAARTGEQAGASDNAPYTVPVMSPQSPTTLASKTWAGLGPVVFSDAGGTVYAINEEGTNAAELVTYQSTDGGSTWQVRGRFSSPSGMCGFSGTMAVDGKNASTMVLVAFVSGDNFGSIPLPATGVSFVSHDRGQSWSQGPNATKSFVTDYCSGAFVTDDANASHLMFSANDPASGNGNRIMQVVTTDAGNSWSDARLVAKITTQVAPRWPSAARMGPSGSHRLMVAYEQRDTDATATWSVGGVTSADNGASWTAPATALRANAGEMYAAPNLTRIDDRSLIVSVQHSYGSHENTVGNYIDLVTAKVPKAGMPVFDNNQRLGVSECFPAWMAMANKSTLLVVSKRSSDAGTNLTPVVVQH